MLVIRYFLILSLISFTSCSGWKVNDYKNNRNPSSEGELGCSIQFRLFIKNIKKNEQVSELVTQLKALTDDEIIEFEARAEIEHILMVNLHFKRQLNLSYANLASELMGATGEEKKVLKSRLKALETKMEGLSPRSELQTAYDSFINKTQLTKRELSNEIEPDILDILEMENRYLLNDDVLPNGVKDDFSAAIAKIKRQSRLEESEEGLEFLDSEAGQQVANQAAEIFTRTQSPQAASNYLGSALNVNPRYLFQKSKYKTQLFFAKNVYRPTLDFARHLLEHAGEFFRKYWSKQPPSRELQRWQFVEQLHEKGKSVTSFGYDIYKGWVDVIGAQAAPDKTITNLKERTKMIGRDLITPEGRVVKVKPIEVSSMMNISGMSFPQLSAESHITLLATQVKLAKQTGSKVTINTGEGGPLFHLALIDGDVEKLRKEVIYWGLETGDLKPGTMDFQAINVRIEEIMKLRDAALGDEGVDSTQIVAQFGSALNGIRSKDGFEVDFQKLKEIAEHDNVGMVQFKLDQAAKRGSKVDNNKVDPITAAMRRIDRRKGVQSPKTIDEFTNKELAKLIKATKIATKKPVSLKMTVGDLNFAYSRLKFLRDHDALPDHIQIDGASNYFSGGTGNSALGAGVSMHAPRAIISMDAMLKKLKVRDEVYIEASGGVILPNDGIELMALGADGIATARFWMGAALGCGRVRQCANGSCPYGIAAKNSVFAKGLDPKMRSEKGVVAANEWRNMFIDKLGELGVQDWRNLRKKFGITVNDPKISQRITKTDGNNQQVFLRTYYQNYLRDWLSPIMDDAEVDQYLNINR